VADVKNSYLSQEWLASRILS